MGSDRRRGRGQYVEPDNAEQSRLSYLHIGFNWTTEGRGNATPPARQPHLLAVAAFNRHAFAHTAIHSAELRRFVSGNLLDVVRGRDVGPHHGRNPTRSHGVVVFSL